MSRFVSFDDGLASVGYIEPVFDEEIVGWANAEIVVNAGLIPVHEFGSDTPVDWVPAAFQRHRLPEAIPIKRRVLRWKLA